MVEGKEDSEVKHPQQQPLPFIEVLCNSSGKIRRFSAGTEAGFAVNLINKKLLGRDGGGNCLLATYIEAVKAGEEEEEAVSFGPNSMLVDYGSSWKLQTVIDPNGDKGQVHVGAERVQKAYAHGSHPTTIQQSPLSILYIGKILVAVLLLFVFGAVFTLFLENLPQFILYINSSL